MKTILVLMLLLIAGCTDNTITAPSDYDCNHNNPSYLELQDKIMVLTAQNARQRILIDCLYLAAPFANCQGGI